MERGRWPGARDKKIGSRLHELIEDTEENRNAIPDIVKEAWQPLTDEGSIDNIQVEVGSVTGDTGGKVAFIATYTNLITGDDEAHSIPAPWIG
jgi:hypothetical protein